MTQRPGADDAGRRRIPVTVIGGYLGAGKTTLVNQLLTDAVGEHPERIAVLVNDFGSVNIDASLIVARDDDMIQLANGCICCSLSEGFAQAMQRIDELARRPDRLVIETSGVADPRAVAQYAHLPGFRLDAVVVLADVETIRGRSRDRYVGRQVLEQLRCADLIALTKTDLIDAASLVEVRHWMADTAPGIRVVDAQRSHLPHDVVFGSSPLRAAVEIGDGAPDVHGHDPLHRAWTLVGDGPIGRGRLETMIAALPPSIVRAKGVLSLAGEPGRWVLQLVDGRSALTELPPAEAVAEAEHDEVGCRLVFIGPAAIDQDSSITTLATGLGLRLMPPEATT
jgi:G3E family GTPase